MITAGDGDPVRFETGDWFQVEMTVSNIDPLTLCSNCCRSELGWQKGKGQNGLLKLLVNFRVSMGNWGRREWYGLV
ncbi:hypothetical protein E3N88_27562 [Mikania micrantha]|uniref:Uncharacterized protein n=1 Tax=Mikania micrantha TaxID=192012 RepID=A0A5N6MXL9_9ASTR|nr:hypothetical protein E3N88_27562 [Mikania micrantha]